MHRQQLFYRYSSRDEKGLPVLELYRFRPFSVVINDRTRYVSLFNRDHELITRDISRRILPVVP